jgi:hypothetical protein
MRMTNLAPRPAGLFRVDALERHFPDCPERRKDVNRGSAC